MSYFKLPFRIIALVLTLAILVQVAPMRIFASTEEANTENIEMIQEDAVATDINQESESTASEIEENTPLTIVGEVESLRDEGVKHFRMSDGSFMAVSYGVPVHYRDTDGEWQDIDNSMVLTADQNAYQTQNAGVATTFSANLNSGSVFSTSHKGTSVSMFILDTSQAKNIISAHQSVSTMSNLTAIAAPQTELTFDRTTVADIDVEASAVLNPGTTDRGWTAEDVIPENLQSSVLYENVFPGVDMMYTAYSFNVKEEIIVKQPQASYRYDFLLELDGVTAVLNEDGSVSLLDDNNEELYHIPAPFMQDSSGMISYDVEYILTNTSGGVILTVVADADWMNNPDRVYPVKIDPTLEVESREGEIYTSSVASGMPNSTFTTGGIRLGYTAEDSAGEYRAFFHFGELPDIQDASFVTHAELALNMCEQQNIAGEEIPTAIYPVTGDKAAGQTYENWINSLTWNTMPAHDAGNMIDYTTLSETSTNHYNYWDISELVKKWYSTNEENRTLLLRIPDGTYPSYSYAQPIFYGTTAAVTRPILFVSYRSSVGIEPYYTYTTLGVGEAGTAYIADHSGQLKIAKQLASYGSTINPVGLEMYYSSDYFVDNPTADYQPMQAMELTMTMGTGWRLSCVRNLVGEPIDGVNYLKYLDGDGTCHYFVQNASDGIYYDEDGLGLEIVVNSDNSGYTMRDEQGNQWLFNQWGFYYRYIDNNGNMTTFSYSYGNLSTITQQNNGQTSGTVVATVGYADSSNYVSTITDAAGNVYRFGYSGEFLTHVYYNNTLVAVYDYIQRRIYRLHDSQSGYNIHMSYNAGGKISQYKENDGTTDGAIVDVDYTGFTQTRYHDYGPDRVAGTIDDLYAHYMYDYQGRTVSNAVLDYESDVWGASTAAYSGSGTTDKTNNRILRSADMNVMGMQYLRDGGLESPNADFPWILGEGTIRDTTRPRTGAYGIKVTKSLGTSTPIITKNAGYLGTYPYTVSVYVNTKDVSSVTGSGLYMTLVGPNGSTAKSEVLQYVTLESGNAGWTRISVSITPQTGGNHTLYVYNDGLNGTIYLDDFYLESRDVVTEVNLLENGFFQYQDLGWTKDANCVFIGGIGANVSTEYAVALRVHSAPLSSKGVFSQEVKINLPHTETFVLSGWAMVNAMPDRTKDGENRKCGLTATLHYVGGASEAFYVPFNPDIGEWQFTSGIIIPTIEGTIDKIVVGGTYQGNGNYAYFDSLSLTRQAVQQYAYDETTGGMTSSKTTQLVPQTSTYQDGKVSSFTDGRDGEYSLTYGNASYPYRVTSVNNGLIQQSYNYDAAGNVKNTILGQYNVIGKQITTSATYSADGNRLASVTDSAGNTVIYGYSSGVSTMWGLPSSVQDAAGTTVSYTYDTYGRIASTGIANKASLGYNYTEGNLTSVTRTNAANNSTQTYNMVYDGFGNMTSMKVGNRTLATYTYGARNGPMQTSTDGIGHTTYYTYDVLGRPVTVTDAATNGKGLKYTYNSNGQLASTEEVGYSWNVHWNNTYDSAGRRIGVSQYHIQYALFSGFYTYDDSSRLKSENWRAMDSAQYTNEYNYLESDGSLDYMDHATGQRSLYSYDVLRRLSSIASGIHTRTYAYRDISNAQTTTQVSSLAYSGIQSPITFGYTYDTRGNIATYAQTGEGTVTYTYDAQGQLLKAQGDTTYTYTYDDVGNILSASDGTTSHSYTYTDDKGWRDLLTKYDGVEITYDNAGNPTSYYNGTSWNFVWGKLGRLDRAYNNSIDVALYYTEDGLRTAKTVGSKTTVYVYNDGKLMREFAGDYSYYLDFFYDADGRPFALKYNGTNYYYILNLQGDVIRLIDDSGITVAAYEYDPYGKILSATGSMANINPLRYRGYYYDSETQLYYCLSRYYDPQTGRFISADSYASTGQGILGNNMFSYCGNNPVARVDSNGYFWEAIAIGFAAGVVGQYVSDVIGNVKSGKTGIDIFAPTSSASDYLASGVGGAIAAIPGLNLLGTMAVGAAGSVVSDFCKGNINSWEDLGKSALKGGVANGIGYGIAKGMAALKVKEISNMPRSSRKVYLRDNFYGNSQVNANVNLQVFANSSMGTNISIVETQVAIFRAGVYSTVTSTLATMF